MKKCVLPQNQPFMFSKFNQEENPNVIEDQLFSLYEIFFINSCLYKNYIRPNYFHGHEHFFLRNIKFFNFSRR